MLYGPMAHPFFFGKTAPFSDLIIGTGHGDYQAYYGQNESTIWKVGDYDPRQVSGKVIKLLSCKAGAELGPDLVNHGARAFIGYDEDFLWLADPAYYPIPWDDSLAAACLMPVVISLNALLDGATCGEAFAIEKDGLAKNAADTDIELLRSLLQYNRDHAVLLGDATATVSPRPRVPLPFGPPPLLI